MLTLLFAIMMIGVFGRMIGFAIRLSWGFLKVLLTLIFLPGIIIAGFASGLLYLAFPLLAVVGLFSLISPQRGVSRGYYGQNGYGPYNYRSPVRKAPAQHTRRGLFFCAAKKALDFENIFDKI